MSCRDGSKKGGRASGCFTPHSEDLRDVPCLEGLVVRAHAEHADHRRDVAHIPARQSLVEPARSRHGPELTGLSP